MPVLGGLYIVIQIEHLARCGRPQLLPTQTSAYEKGRQIGVSLTLLYQSPELNLALPLGFLILPRYTIAGVLWSSVLMKYLRHLFCY